MAVPDGLPDPVIPVLLFPALHVRTNRVPHCLVPVCPFLPDFDPVRAQQGETRDLSAAAGGQQAASQLQVAAG